MEYVGNGKVLSCLGAAHHGFSYLLARGSPASFPQNQASHHRLLKLQAHQEVVPLRVPLILTNMVRVFVMISHLQTLRDVDTVPVYNGREGKFNMQQLHILNRSLNAWNNDLSDSICLVGYTVNTWMKDSVKQLSLNVQWVVVLASNVD